MQFIFVEFETSIYKLHFELNKISVLKKIAFVFTRENKIKTWFSFKLNKTHMFLLL